MARRYLKIELCPCMKDNDQIENLGNVVAESLFQLQESEDNNLGLILPKAVLRTKGFRVEIIEDKNLLHFWENSDNVKRTNKMKSKITKERIFWLIAAGAAFVLGIIAGGAA